MNPAPQTTTPEAPAEVGAARLPPAVLLAAGLTVLNGLLAAGCFVAWILDRETAVAAVRAAGGAGLLLGMAGILVGAWIQHRRKRSGKPQPGASWSTAAILTGLAATGMLMFIPMVAALNAMLGPRSGG